ARARKGAGEKQRAEERSPAPPLRSLSGGSAAELTEDLVQQRDDAVQDSAEPAAARWRIKEASDRTEEIAQEVSGTLLRRDVENDLVEMHNQPQQVEIERAEREVKDVAGARSLK